MVTESEIQIPVTITIRKELHLAMKRKAKEARMHISAVYENASEKWLDEKQKISKKTIAKAVT